MKRIAMMLLAALMIFLWGAAAADSVGVLPVFVAPEGVTMTENEAWAKDMGSYATRGWLLEGDLDTAAQAIETYANNLEDWGFIMTDEVEPKGMNACYWFFEVDETGYKETTLNGYTFEVYVYGEASADGTKVAMMIGYVPGVTFQEQQWESLFGEEETVWGSVFDEATEPVQPEADGYVIPSFESYAQEVLTPVDGADGAVYLLAVKHANAVNGYIELLEAYGIGGEDESEAAYGYPYCFWLEDCDEELEAEKMETPHGSLRAYVLFVTEEADKGELQITVQYADGLTPKDLGDRWEIEPLSDSELTAVEEFLAEYEAATETTETAPGTIASETSIVSGDGLVLVSPQTFFNGKYMLSSVDARDGVCNFSVYVFAPTSEVSDEELEADGEMYKQALLDSGYFENVKGVIDLAYTGEREVVGATYGGTSVGGQAAINVNEAIRVSLVEGFTFSDVTYTPVEEEAVPAEQTTAPETVVHSASDGEKRCSTCGGSGRVEERCSSCGGDGEKNCISCSGKGYSNCSGCNGSGDRRCGSCGGTGKNGSNRCSICHGTGERTCSSCSGTGKKRCSACSGSGNRDCTSCGGDGKQERSCSSCGGDGWR